MDETCRGLKVGEPLGGARCGAAASYTSKLAPMCAPCFRKFMQSTLLGMNLVSMLLDQHGKQRVQCVSVVIPAYNPNESLLGLALASAAGQDATREIVVVDDASADDTVLRQVGRMPHGPVPVRYVAHDQNCGHAVALATGFSRCMSPLIAFLDADDVWAPTKLAKQLDRLLGDLSLDGMVCQTQESEYLTEIGALGGKIRSLRDIGAPKPARMFSALLIWKDALVRIGLPMPGLGMGTTLEWFDRASHKGAKIGMVEEPLYRRVLHPDNYTRAHAGDILEYHKSLKIALERRRAAER